MTTSQDVDSAVAALRQEVASLHGELTRNGLVGVDRRQRVGAGAGPGPHGDQAVRGQLRRADAGAMVVTDLHGNLVEGDHAPSSDTAAHAYVYRHMPHVGGVVHTHSTYATAWAARGEPIPCVLTMMADEFGGDVPVGPVRPDRRRLHRPRHRRDAARIAKPRRADAQPRAVHHRRDARAAVKAAVMVEEVARTVHIARQLGDAARASTPADIDRLYERYQNVYGQDAGPTGGGDMTRPYADREVWFLTGSQHLYGERRPGPGR